MKGGFAHPVIPFGHGTAITALHNNPWTCDTTGRAVAFSDSLCQLEFSMLTFCRAVS